MIFIAKIKTVNNKRRNRSSRAKQNSPIFIEIMHFYHFIMDRSFRYFFWHNKCEYYSTNRRLFVRFCYEKTIFPSFYCRWSFYIYMFCVSTFRIQLPKLQACRYQARAKDSVGTNSFSSLRLHSLLLQWVSALQRKRRKPKYVFRNMVFF